MEREQVDRISTAKLMGVVVAIGMIMCLIVTIAVTGLAWILGRVASSLTADTCFLTATIVVCTAVICLVLFLIAATITDNLKSASLLAESVQEADDSNETEFESAELARQFGRQLLRNALVDDVVLVAQDPIDPPSKRRRHHSNATKARQRRSTK